MHFNYFSVIWVAILFCDEIIPFKNKADIITETLQLINDVSTCSDELDGLVNEASVLSISVTDIIHKFQRLENASEKEIQEISNAKQTILQSFPSGQGSIGSNNQNESVLDFLTDITSAITMSNVTELRDGICLKNTLARSYLVGNETSHPGLTWKKGKWQKLRRKKKDQNGIWLGSFDACSAVNRRYDELCYISGLVIMEDGTIAVSDSDNFLIRVFEITGAPLREFYFEPLLLGKLERLSGNGKAILANVKLLNDRDAKLFVDLNDGFSKIVNESEFNVYQDEIAPNCTIKDPRVRHSLRYQRYDGVTFVVAYSGYERNTILQYSSNCSFIGVAARTRYKIEDIVGIADLLVVNLDTGGRKRNRDRIAIYHIPVS